MNYMSKPYGRCRICRRPKTEVTLSKRGLCQECGTMKATFQVAAQIAGAHALRVYQESKKPHVSDFASLEDTRST